jgi:hypothetical protein
MAKSLSPIDMEIQVAIERYLHQLLAENVSSMSKRKKKPFFLFPQKADATAPIHFSIDPLKSLGAKRESELAVQNRHVNGLLSINGMEKIHLENTKTTVTLFMDGAKSLSSNANGSDILFIALIIAVLVTYFVSPMFTWAIFGQDILKLIVTILGFVFAISKIFEILLKAYGESDSHHKIMGYKYCIALLEIAMREV